MIKKTLVTLSVGASLLFSVLPASAHASVDHTSPATNGSIDAGVQTVSVVFDEKVLNLANSSELIIKDGDGNDVKVGCVQVDGATLSADALLATAGTYEATWRTVADDGHPISGKFNFTVNGTSDAEFASCDDLAKSESGPVVIAKPLSADVKTYKSATAQDNGSVIIYVIGGVVVVAAGLTVLVKRRKPKN